MLSLISAREISDNLGQPVNCISMSNDGNCVLAGCLDSTLRLLDRYVCIILLNLPWVNIPACLIILSCDRSTGEQLQEYKGHTCKVSLQMPKSSFAVLAFFIDLQIASFNLLMI